MKMTNIGYVAKLNKQKTKKGRDRYGVVRLGGMVKAQSIWNDIWKE